MKNHKKIGLLLSMMMIIGSVVGIGIFFKNGSVSKAVDGDGISWLLAWVLGGLISIAAAINFAEIGSFSNSKFIGLSNWVYKVTRKKELGYHVSISYAIFYWGILNTVIGIFASEALFYFFVSIHVVDKDSIKIWMHVIVGLSFTVFFMMLNILSARMSGHFQFMITIIKFVPLIVALFLGILFPNTFNNGGSNGFLKNAFTIKGIIVALPAVLFAYDAFLVSGSVSEKTKNPTKTLPKAILFGMILIVVLYSLIAVSSILHSKGEIFELIIDVLPKEFSSKIVAIVMFFIFISALGVTNGISSAFTNEVLVLVKNKMLFGSAYLLKKFKENLVFIFYLSIIEIFYFLVLIVPGIVLETDILFDAVSNYPTVIFFMIYGGTIFMYTIKRNQIHETKKINGILFYVASAISVTGILFMELAYLFFQIQNLFTDNINPSSWGVFWAGKANKLILNWVPILLYSVSVLFFFTIPVLNLLLEKIFFKRDILRELSEQTENQVEY